MELYHYSHKANLTEVNPSFHGTGIAGAEAKRKASLPEQYLDRAYFGTPSYRKEPGLGAHKYQVTEALKLYAKPSDFPDLQAMVTAEMERLGLVGNDAFITIAERTLHEQGFDGLLMGNVALTFRPVKVVPCNVS